MGSGKERKLKQIKISHTNDFRFGRVKVVRAPVGHNAKAVITHRFVYEADQHGGEPKRDQTYSGRTHVYDAYLRKTTYTYNEEHRPTAVIRYGKDHKPYSEECYVWDDRYPFPANIFDRGGEQKGETRSGFSSALAESIHASVSERMQGIAPKVEIETLLKACLKTPVLQVGGEGNLLGKYQKDRDGNIQYAHFFAYDRKGNIIVDRFYGDLTGRGKSKGILLDAHKMPKSGLSESYERHYTYSNDRLNLLLSEVEENGKSIHYDYIPETDLVSAKYIKESGEIRLRQFFHYDENATLVRLVKDDGTSKREENLIGVTERHITLFTPRKEAPFGLPEQVEHRYLDTAGQKEKLLKRIVFHHSKEGHLLKQDHYDAEGCYCYSLQWDYDAHGNVIREVNALGDTITREYDANDNLKFERGPRAGDVKKYVYDFSNRLIELKTKEEGKKWSVLYTYDLIGNRVSETDRYGNKTQYEYDDFNRLIRTVYPSIHGEKKLQTEIAYDSLDRPVLQTDIRGYTTAKTYNARGKVTSLLHPDGQLERFEYNTDGGLAKAIASNGTVTTYTYDYMGRVLSEKKYDDAGFFLYEITHTYNSFHKLSTTDAEGVKTYFEYDGAGRIVKTTRLDKVERMEYDALGRCIKKIELCGKRRERISCTEYNFLNQVIEERIEDEKGSVLKKVGYDYDLLGNRTHVTEEGGAGISRRITEYNRDQKPVLIVDPDRRETHITYEEAVNDLGQIVLRTKTTDPMGRQTFITYDALGYPASIVKRDVNGVLLAHQDLMNDGSGNVVTLIDYVVIHGQEGRTIKTAFEYDSMGRLVCLTQAVGLPEQRITYTQYNGFGEKDKVIRHDGVSISYSYDSLGRMQSQRASNGSFHYLYHYNGLQQLSHLEDVIQRTTTSYQYDKQGRIASETLSTGVVIAYAYDALGRVETLTLPDECVIKYTYDALNLRQVSRYKGRELLYTHCYDEFDLSGLNLKMTAPHGQEVYFSYDLQNRFCSIEGGGFKQSEARYDAGGRLRGYNWEDAIGKAAVTFVFDDNDHLVKEEGMRRNVYVCNSLHDRLVKNHRNCTVNCLHQLLFNGDAMFTYNFGGSLESKLESGTLTRYRYDACDRLIAVEEGGAETTYLYDPLNRRVAKKQGGKTMRYLFVGQDEVGAVDEQGHLIELRVLGQGKGAEIGASVAVELRNKVFVPTHDFQGNIVALADLAGHPIESYRYTAFGERTIYNASGEKIEKSSVGNPWLFSSKRWDEESGFVYFGRRYYDPVNGRWVTADPSGFVDGTNLYAYLHHRPVQAFDLYGLEEEGSYPLRDVEYHDKEPHHPEQSQQKDDAPLGFVEKKKGKKDRMFFCGIKQMSDAGISWVNGIMNSLREATDTAEVFSQMADDQYVTFVHNRSNGFVADLVRCFFELYFYMETSAERNLRAKWDAYFESVGPEARLLHCCHSEGAIITRNALMRYPEELRQRIIVIAIAPGAYIDRKYAGGVTHYRSKRDIVPLFDIAGASRCRDTTVVLKPHPDAPLFDHSVNSPTYAPFIKIQTNAYIEKYR